jgi:hypothetical protein
MVVAHIIDALRQNKQEEDYQVELTIFSSENREEHEGPRTVVRMPNGLPPDKAAWPMVLGFIGKQYGSSGSPKPAAACLVTHAYYREVPIQKPESTPLPEDLDTTGLAASVCDWLNSGMPEVNDTAVDDEKKAQENYWCRPRRSTVAKGPPSSTSLATSITASFPKISTIFRSVSWRPGTKIGATDCSSPSSRAQPAASRMDSRLRSIPSGKSTQPGGRKKNTLSSQRLQ